MLNKMSSYKEKVYRPITSNKIGLKRAIKIIGKYLDLTLKDKASESEQKGNDYLEENLIGMKNRKRRTKSYYQHIALLLKDIVYIYKAAYESQQSSHEIYAGDRYDEDSEEGLFKIFKEFMLKDEIDDEKI